MTINEPNSAATRPIHPNPDLLANHELLENPKFRTRSDSRVSSDLRIRAIALGMGLLVFLVALGIQWIIYDRFLHQDGIRIVGSLIAAIIATLLVQTLETSARNQRLRELRRLEVIALLNHHIRNALQTIVNCSGDSDSTNTIRVSVERIEWALGEVLPELDPKTHKAASSSR